LLKLKLVVFRVMLAPSRPEDIVAFIDAGQEDVADID